MMQQDKHSLGHLFMEWNIARPKTMLILLLCHPQVCPLRSNTPLAGRPMKRPSERGLLVGARRHALVLGALGHPRGSDLGQELEIECIGNHHHLMPLEVFVMQPNPGSPLDPL